MSVLSLVLHVNCNDLFAVIIFECDMTEVSGQLYFFTQKKGQYLLFILYLTTAAVIVQVSRAHKKVLV